MICYMDLYETFVTLGFLHAITMNVTMNVKFIKKKQQQKQTIVYHKNNQRRHFHINENTLCFCE